MKIKLFYSALFAIGALIFLYSGFYIATSSSVDATIKHSRDIERNFQDAAQYIENYMLKNQRHPEENEFYHRSGVNDNRISEMITYNSCTEPLPEKFGERPANSYYLGYWRGEWCEFFVGWDQVTSLQFDQNEFYPLKSKTLTVVAFGFSVIKLIFGVLSVTKSGKERS